MTLLACHNSLAAKRSLSVGICNSEHTESSPRDKGPCSLLGGAEDAEVVLAVTLATIPIGEESEAGALTPGKKMFEHLMT